MPAELLWLLLFIGTVAVVIFVEFVGSKLTDKGEDAIRSAHKRKKNSQNPEKRENLADRYKN